MPGDSHVRIVRLSDVKGTLALDRKTGLGFEQTMQNMPIVEGEKLKTEDGYAEVEFEDNTTTAAGAELAGGLFAAGAAELGGEGFDDEGGEGDRVCEHGEHEGQRVSAGGGGYEDDGDAVDASADAGE